MPNLISILRKTYSCFSDIAARFGVRDFNVETRLVSIIRRVKLCVA